MKIKDSWKTLDQWSSKHNTSFETNEYLWTQQVGRDSRPKMFQTQQEFRDDKAQHDLNTKRTLKKVWSWRKEVKK